MGSARKSLTSPATTADDRLDPKGARSSRGPRVWISMAGRNCERAVQFCCWTNYERVGGDLGGNWSIQNTWMVGHRFGQGFLPY